MRRKGEREKGKGKGKNELFGEGSISKQSPTVKRNT
jgi:hypothetical protein